MRCACTAKKLQSIASQYVTWPLSKEILTSPSRRWDAPIPFPGKTRANQFFRPGSARVSRGTPVRLGLLSDCTSGERRLLACWFRLLAETNSLSGFSSASCRRVQAGSLRSPERSNRASYFTARTLRQYSAKPSATACAYSRKILLRCTPSNSRVPS